MAPPRTGDSYSLGRDPIPVLESLPVIIIVGTVLGFLSGLGIGGGSLLIVWLTTVLHTDPMTARSINLLFFIPSALVACIIRFRRGELDWKTPIPAITAGCICAVLGSCIANMLETELLKKLFGVVLLLAGGKELFYRERKAK